MTTTISGRLLTDETIFEILSDFDASEKGVTQAEDKIDRSLATPCLMVTHSLEGGQKSHIYVPRTFAQDARTGPSCMSINISHNI